MSTFIQVPPYCQFIQPVKRFQAVFNTPTVNKYDFGVAANTDQTFLEMKRQHLYLIDTYSFSASMDEGLFLEAVDEVSGIPSTQVGLRVRSQKNKLIYKKKMPIINYIDNAPTQLYAYSDQADILTITFEGIASQPAALNGVLNIYTQFSCNVYEIRNKDWIDNWLSRTKDGQAVNLA